MSDETAKEKAGETVADLTRFSLRNDSV